MARGDWAGALRIANKFPNLGDEKEAITRAWAAHTRREFYLSIGHDPDALIATGLAAIRRRYGLDDQTTSNEHVGAGGAG
jgi:hypothetical protein